MLATGALAGCPVAADGDCAPGDDCGAGAVCTDLAECAAAEDAPRWRIAWTVNGAAVSVDAPGDCAAIDELALTVSAPDDLVTYRPVTCALGRFDFTALPSRYDLVILEALAGGDSLDRVRAERQPEVVVDLVF